MSRTKRHDPLRIDQRGIDTELGFLETKWGECMSVMRCTHEINGAWRQYRELPSDARWQRLDEALKRARALKVEGAWEYDDV